MSLAAVLVVALLALMVIAALLASAEVALLRVPRVTVEVRAEEGDRRARVLLGLLDDLPLVLNTVLLAVLFVQVSAAALSGYLAQRWFGGLATTAAAGILTLVLFVYSEAIPKTLAVRSPLRLGLMLARSVALLVRVLGLLTRVLLRAADAQTPGVGASARTAFTEDELRLLAVESAEAGEIEHADVELVHRSFAFGDACVGDVFVSRGDVVAVPEGMSPGEALTVAVDSGHRRLPVYRGDLDSIQGVVRLRELAAAAHIGTPSTVAPLAQPILTVAREEPIAQVLSKMQGRGPRFGVVADPDGSTLGIVTIEDIVAELVGEIEELD
jgi:CBS domain containing-hemolysin-like protein